MNEKIYIVYYAVTLFTHAISEKLVSGTTLCFYYIILFCNKLNTRSVKLFGFDGLVQY